MKFIKPIMYAGLISVMLAGCGTGNNNDRFTSDDNEPLGVRYNPTDNRDDVNNRNDGVGTNVNNRNNDTMNNNNDRNIDLADDIADKVTNLQEVEDAIVLVTNRNAYVAVKLSDDQEDNKMKNDVEKKIARVVRDTDHDFDNIYISENPDFYDRMREYGDEIRNGRPISGFFDEFTEAIERVFPDAR